MLISRLSAKYSASMTPATLTATPSPDRDGEPVPGEALGHGHPRDGGPGERRRGGQRGDGGRDDDGGHQPGGGQAAPHGAERPGRSQLAAEEQRQAAADVQQRVWPPRDGQGPGGRGRREAAHRDGQVGQGHAGQGGGEGDLAGRQCSR